MKSRSLKLREAHNTKNAATVCSIIWGGDDNLLLTSAASEPSISIHDQSQPSIPAKVLRHHKDGVTALAFNPGFTSLASASIDHSVKLYSFPDWEFQSNLTRFTLPIRSLAFNKSGSLLAAAGDDDGIKLIATIDSSVSRVLKGHKGSITSLAFDPKNEYLSSVDSFGTVIYWELSTGNAIHTLKAIAPNCDSDNSALNIIAWSPDGEMLAVPGLRNDVVMYDRDTSEKLFTLKGEHEKAVCFLSWSPNGKYMATSSLDKQVLIWDIDQRQDIDRQKFEDRICCVAWKPNGNALAVIDVMGKFGVWESPVPSSMKSPVDGMPNSNVNGLLLFEDEEEEGDNDYHNRLGKSESLDDDIEGSLGEPFSVSRKRSRKKSRVEENSDDDIDGEEGLIREIESKKRKSTKQKESLCNGTEDCAISKGSIRLKMQEAFQSGSTPFQNGKRRFLAYNMLGSITTIENEAYSHIEVDFHDTGRGARVPAMTDHFGFTMAALNEDGSIFANPCKGEKNMSTLMYRPFCSWANNSEWSMRFEGEEVKAVAIGSGWLAAATSLNYLRIFSEGGLQKHIICLSGPIVTAVGYKDQLAIVIHASDCLPSGDQMLEVIVFNIYEKTQPIKCRLPLTSNSCLSWFGFSEEGKLSAYDSKGVLRVFTKQFGGTWLPLFSASRAKKSEEENYWVVGLNGSKLFCIVCNTSETYPSVNPKPVLTVLDLSFPLASSDLGADNLENEFIMKNLQLSEAHNKIEEMATSGLDTTSLEDEAFDTEAAMDRCILRLIASCCNCDKLARATELARLLTLEKSLKGAIKLATALKLPALAERFNGILEERLSDECRAAAQNVNTCTSKRIVETSAASPSTPLPQPSISKQENIEEKHTVKAQESCKNTNGVNSTNPFAKASNAKEKSEYKEESAKTLKTSELNLKGSSVGVANIGSNEKPSARPINPFAKTSNNQDNSSLIDSIKKMRKADHEKSDRASSKKKKT